MKDGKLEWMITRWQGGRVERSVETSAAIAETRAQEKNVLNLHPRMLFQEFQGFGAAFTESAGWVLNSLPPAQAEAILADCYGEGGLGYSWARVPVDSCDFSLSSYSACEPGSAGPRLNRESFRKHEQAYIIPWLQKARALVSSRGAEALRLCMVPWSPPAYMKSNASRTGGGSLLPRFRQDWPTIFATTRKRTKPAVCPWPS